MGSSQGQICLWICWQKIAENQYYIPMVPKYKLNSLWTSDPVEQNSNVESLEEQYRKYLVILVRYEKYRI